MLLIKSGFDVIGNIDGMQMLKSIERAGRTCYKSETYIDDNSCIQFVQMIINRGHETVLEHEKITVRVICDRGISHEIVRHRIASYSQESTRYCNYGKSEHLTFVIPSWYNTLLEGVNFVTSNNPIESEDPEMIWLHAMQTAENCYLKLLKAGWRPEQARSVLPNSLKTEIVMTMNLREWRHFFKLRAAKAAHPDMRALAITMLKAFQTIVPVVFDDIKGGE